MENLMRLFFSPSTKKYYCVDDVECSKCNEEINNWFVHVVFWDKFNSIVKVFCANCFNKERSKAIVREYRLVILDESPFDAYPIFIRPPDLIDRKNCSVFDISKLESVKTKDKTIHASRETFFGFNIGNKEYIHHNPEVYKNLDEVEFNNVFKQIPMDELKHIQEVEKHG